MQFLKSPHFARRGGTLYQVITGPPEENRPFCCHRELREKASLLEQAMDDTLLVMARMVEQKDPYTAGHQLCLLYTSPSPRDA